MNRKPHSLLFLLLLSTISAHAATLNLNDYLSLVFEKNNSIKSADKSIEAFDYKVIESNSIHSPEFYGDVTRISDAKKNALFSMYNRYTQNNLTLGLREQFNFGLKAGVSYTLSKINYVDFKGPFWEGLPKVEASFSLLRNRLGSETREIQNQVTSQLLAQKYSESFKKTALKAEAEGTYIRLAAARSIVQLQKQSILRATELLKWNERRRNQNLGESSDYYQAEANLQAKKLQLLTAEEDEKSAARAFNALRQIDSNEVSETLQLPDVSSADLPARAPVREDILAQTELIKASLSQAKIAKERNSTTLEIFGQYALNSRDAESTQAFKDSFQNTMPTSAIGIRFSAPLFYGDRDKVLVGYNLESIALETELTQKQFQSDIDFKNLTENLEKAKKRFEVSKILTDIQKKKSINERERLRQGRSTTYQTLMFENDFDLAQMSQIQAHTEILSLIAKLKTFSNQN